MSINSDNNLSQDKVSNLRSLSRKSLKVAFIIAAMTAVINAIWLTYRFAQLNSNPGSTSLVIVQIDPSVSLMLIRIGFGLLLAAVCLWYRRVASLVMSMAALIWVLIEYTGWYLWSASIRREAGVAGVPGFLSFYGANAWNVAVIVIVLALLTWEVKTLVRFWVPVRR